MFDMPAHSPQNLHALSQQVPKSIVGNEVTVTRVLKKYNKKFEHILVLVPPIGD